LEKSFFPFFRYLFGRRVLCKFAVRSLQSLGNRILEFVVELLKTLRADVLECFLRSSVKDQLAAHQHNELVEQLDVLHRVRCEDYGAT